MRRWKWNVVAAGLALCASAGCRETAAPASPSHISRPAKTVPSAAPASPWLDDTRQIEQQERALTPGGTELREAQFVTSAGQGQLVLLLRDYAERLDQRPDLQWVVSANTTDGSAQRVSLPAAALPVHLITAGSRQTWGAAAFPVEPRPETPAVPDAHALALGGEQDGVPAAPAAPAVDTEAAQHARGYILKSAQFAVYQPAAAVSAPPAPAAAGESEPTPVPAPVPHLTQVVLGDGLCPVGFSGDKLLFCRTLTSVAVTGGLVIPKVDWASQAEYVPLDGGEVTLTSDPAFLVSPDGSAAAGLAPVLGSAAGSGWELHYWQTRRGDASRVLASLNAPTAGFAPWSTTLGWLDLRTLAVLSVLPPLPGDPEAPATLSLLAVDTASGGQRVVTNHLPPASTLCTSDGAVIYAVPLPTSGAGVRWEVWASGSDGLSQRQLYASPHAVRLTVADAYGGRVLVNRLFFDNADGDSQLRNQLLELAPGPLSAWTISPAALASPLGPPVLKPDHKPAAASRKPGSGSQFIPDELPESGGGRYDRKGDTGGGDSGGGGDGPGLLPPLPGT